MIESKNSPSRNNSSKRPRKVNTFSNPVVNNTEVGDFQGGYFIMPDDSNGLKKNAHSPSRRKHSEPPLPNFPKKSTSPSSTPKKSQSPPSSYQDVTYYETTKGGSQPIEFMTPGKPASSKSTAFQSFITNTPDKSEYTKDIPMSAPSTPSPMHNRDTQSSTPCYHWAGPAFGNAPHPSSLPIPEFPAVQPTIATAPGPYFYAHGRSLSVDSSLSSMNSYPQDPRSQSPPTHQSLDQLSIDLRRMLNIGGNETPVYA